MTEQLHEILYCSMLAPGLPTDVVGHIVAQARARNAQEAITGLLVFDGLRFCQHIEGPRRNVLRLLNRLDADPRHTEMKVLHEGVIEARRYERFELGLAHIEEGEDVEDLRRLDGAEALAQFIALRPRWDI
ncbi:BLUF domain-containing protein [Variovorax sp. JS1663]|uniref:BLUF domain-containing protein n=1 Tax=Variovorax sp. JS1663 TaxID=1851577 RepID=UPI000B349B41|nr:BLUF domain-containing protein [Variovorax sp. JS1663]OUL99852.1 blue light sensor protein [Variovorax sp. JS1663]